MRLFVTTLCLLLAGCASIPTAEESEGGLFVFPLEVINESTEDFSFIYTFEIVNQQDELVAQARIDPNVYKHSYVVGPLPTGHYTIKQVYSRPSLQGNYRFTYRDNAVEIGYEFDIAEDEITKFGYVFNVSRKVKDNLFSTSWNFYRAFSDEKSEDKFQEDLAKRVDLNSWLLAN